MWGIFAAVQSEETSTHTLSHIMCPLFDSFFLSVSFKLLLALPYSQRSMQQSIETTMRRMYRALNQVLSRQENPAFDHDLNQTSFFRAWRAGTKGPFYRNYLYPAHALLMNMRANETCAQMKHAHR
jgi:hypothetical protein